jgi:hypothetical protein
VGGGIGQSAGWGIVLGGWGDRGWCWDPGVKGFITIARPSIHLCHGEQW